MGVDPLTHEPLQKDNEESSLPPSSLSHSDDNHQNHKPAEIDDGDDDDLEELPKMEEHQQCSSKEAMFTTAPQVEVADFDPWMSQLWSGSFFNDLSWNFGSVGGDNEYSDFGMQSSSSIASSSEWLMDFQDFGEDQSLLMPDNNQPPKNMEIHTQDIISWKF